MEREAALDLLRSQHSFPGSFEFRVVVRPPDRSPVLSAMTAAAGPDSVLEEVTERPSRKGTYLALRVKLRVPAAESVLDVYEVIGKIEGVLTAM